MSVIISIGVFTGDYLDKTNNFRIPLYTILLSLSSFFIALFYSINRIKNLNEKK